MDEMRMTAQTTRSRWPRQLAVMGALAVSFAGLGGCTPTVHVQIDPITINAKLDADVRIRLDKEVQQEIQQNPNLF